MDRPTEQIQSELEAFRKQWQAEVSARTKNAAGSSKPPASLTQAGPSAQPTRRNEFPHQRAASKTAQLEEDDVYVKTQLFEETYPASSPRGHNFGRPGDAATTGKDPSGAQEPRTALDFYEEAVEKETTGKLGDSLQLYRKAFRMDDNVDRSYREKHFPGRWTRSAQLQAQAHAQANPSGAAVTVPNTAHHSLQGPAPPSDAVSVPDLIASFADFKIEGAPPECEGMPPPPCPLAALPNEILVHVLRDVAVADVGDFVRLAKVCRGLAYLVATEDHIWRRVCLGSEVGFAAMHYRWQLGFRWEPLDAVQELADAQEEEGEVVYTMDELARRRLERNHAATYVLLHSLYASSWQMMFRRRPRVRFNGCYISTVNYIRAGQASVHQIAWNSPVHIVTYYRYLRLFRDGSALSLLTTDEPASVVHHLTVENCHLHRRHGGDGASALRGRWRLSSSLSVGGSGSGSGDKKVGGGVGGDDTEGSEGDLYIETEGVGAKYMYRMELTFHSGSGRTATTATRINNRRLAWKGFWSYNMLTDDWAEFTLKNDKPFFFSRVKSYGSGY
ncbi:hypothetical protein GGS23DRAFT_576962 [Durotheca rogersii]|uniref:uncharacterized protein n=1 Tax=Durotheca rogersii TaxID=419775 RepID=UPI00221EE52A|nr:uncharacterized protein GGS23DRAFT_576962 [Durotheca rogersii]KAI5861479.1 hypothetical protein GGS23DRAFT_576962 [Durotheca rogersii]